MEGKSQEWIDQTESKIREMFDLFDKDKTDSIVQEEIGTVMRALGVFPSERALKMLTILATNEWEPDSSDILLQAFRTIDEENKGYITSDVIEELLTTRGTPLRNIELESFLSIAKDPETGFVYYEDYVSLLTKYISNKKK
eukprot:gene22462-29085_t